MSSPAPRHSLFEAFLASRITLEDLSLRAEALGEELRVATIASYLTGHTSMSDARHDVVAQVINARLRELELPAAVPYRH